ncbi:MAG: sulfatase-like hydrolase/transferase [Deltaproteobacteria bacterium]|nr:sulfatase-like hydrolase/transferase [Candidatus Tharpella sp.]
MTTILSNLKFILILATILLITLSLMRLFLLLYNRELTTAVPKKDLVRSFAIGCRFDMIIIGAIMLFPIITQFFPWSSVNRSLPLYWCSITGAAIIFLSVVELEFYRQFHTRLNSLVFDYLKEDPKTVSSMIWNGCPVLRYLGLWLVISSLTITGFFVDNAYASLILSPNNPGVFYHRLLIFMPLLALAVVACRGTLRSGPPLRWGDAYHSTHLFANHLALNGVYTLIKAILDGKKQKSRKKWLRCMPKTTALDKTRKLLLQADDKLSEPEKQPLKREHQPQPTKATIKNVVVIMMESFSAQYIGALGNPHGISPEFDRLAEKGVLFDHFFSNGTHTHQGIFAALAGFPNLPGFETLMQQPQGATGFSGLAELLRKRDYQSLYTYNGDFAWDNQEGFFRNQGMTNFIGRFDYKNPEFIDPTWGVSDNDMFNRAHQELENLAPDKPFFAILQTLSNHLPFTIPEPLPITKVSGQGLLDGHLTAMRYADWALGQFFAQAKNSAYFAETLFVLLGDHGFCVPQQLTDIELLRFHIPLLLLAPGLQKQYGPRRSTIGTQVDLVPTIMGLLNKPFTHHCWGRNLLNIAADDPGFGIIKPSGSDPTVAMLNGDRILVHPPDGHNSQLYRYQLYPRTQAEVVNNPACANEMETTLQAYVQTAMDALLTGHAGV